MFAPRYLTAYLLKDRYSSNPLWQLLCLCCLPELFDQLTTDSIWLRLLFHIGLVGLGRSLVTIAPNRDNEPDEFEYSGALRRWVKKAAPNPRFWPLPRKSRLSTPNFWHLVSGVCLGHLVLSLAHDLVFAFAHVDWFDNVSAFLVLLQSPMYVLWFAFEIGQLLVGYRAIQRHLIPNNKQAHTKVVLGIVIFTVLLSLDYIGVFSRYSNHPYWTLALTSAIHCAVCIFLHWRVDDKFNVHSSILGSFM